MNILRKIFHSLTAIWQSRYCRLLLLIFVIAFGLRLWGIGFGLPYEYHVDEVQYVYQAMGMGSRGLEPIWWNNPPFYKYLLLAQYGVLFVVGRGLGWHTSVAQFGEQQFLDPTYLFLLGRATTALLGAFTIFLVYGIAKVAYKERRIGLIAAWFLAVTFIHARDSHYAVNDVPVTFFMMLAMWAAVNITQKPQRRWYLVAGVALGLGFATKYSAIFVSVPLLLAHIWSPDMRLRPPFNWQWRRFALLMVITAVTAILASPYFVLTPGRVIQEVYQDLYLPGQQGFDGWLIDPAGGYLFYLKTLLWGLGWGLFLLVMVAIPWSLFQRQRAVWVILSLPLVVYLTAARQEMFFARFIIPAVPPLLILGAAFLHQSVKRLSPPGKVPIVLMTLVLLLTIQPSVSLIRHNYLLTQTDTRTLAKDWIEANIPAGARIGLDWRFHGPQLSTPEREMPLSNRIYDVTLADGNGLSDNPLSWYVENGFEYLITSSFISDIALQDETGHLARQQFYASLPVELQLLQTFQSNSAVASPPFIFDEMYGPAVSLWQRERPGPTIHIYQINVADRP